MHITSTAMHHVKDRYLNRWHCLLCFSFCLNDQFYISLSHLYVLCQKTVLSLRDPGVKNGRDSLMLAMLEKRCYTDSSANDIKMQGGKLIPFLTSGNPRRENSPAGSTLEDKERRAGVGGYLLYDIYQTNNLRSKGLAKARFPGAREKFVQLPKRDAQIEKLKSGKEYDVLVIGGGASGTGAALDATTRGLKTALVERDDFAAGTSSRSTKLIHGGVRYLQKAVMQLDKGALSLVFEALHERQLFLDAAPHLTHPLPIMTPCYNYWEIPYYWVGLKLYDLLAGSQNIGWSHFLSQRESGRQFPMLAQEGLKGSVVYFDGQMDDARMNVSLALTAAAKGADVANHVEVTALLKGADGKVNGAKVRDTQTGDEWNVAAKVVINATGPFSDSIRKMDDPEVQNIILPSSGVHVMLPNYYSPNTTGLIVPKTADGRVVFMLPWQGYTIAGTTDSSVEITHNPKPHDDEVEFILEALSDYLSVQVRRQDVQAAWSGIRPLAKDPKATSTASASRDHVIDTSDSGLVTIAGGKWTTYRRMAQDVVDKAVEVGGLKDKAGPCLTKKIPMIGGEKWEPAFFTVITQNYRRQKTTRDGQVVSAKFPSDVAQHLSHSYGTRSLRVAQLAQQKYGDRLANNYPYIEAEVVYACQEEYAVNARDLISRRLRLAFLDSEVGKRVAPRVVKLMGDTLKWDEERRASELKEVLEYLEIFNAVPEVKGNVTEGRIIQE
ncbi:Glycerol-3-phosphate dehydrogenase SDP6 [Planoprotostelium fungivorum]|uniref:Glycerol-3-phosphate dehydrogenase n=1 Tax=Planoprotostelium fungivorum TaxID=1890364 RepID=A0A2P6NAK6_9EUKA|nr:Glycerol-3-phosphate dehydrogenase SDP6 [Planoprotostelium fungivorum]